VGPRHGARPELLGDILLCSMHFPVYIPVFGFQLHPHTLFETLAYFVGFRIFLRLRRAWGDAIPNNTRWWALAAAVVGAASGSKLLYWLENPDLTWQHRLDPAFLLGGKSIVGGLAGGLITVEATKLLLGERRSTGDLMAFAIAIGAAIGRIGCFLTGLTDDTYGTPTSLPWGVNFGDGIARHPTQLYEIVFLLSLAAFVSRMMRRPHVDGDVFKAFMVSYATWRLLVDFIKPEHRFAGLSFIQWACVVLLLYYTRDIIRWIAPNRGRSPQVVGAEPSSADVGDRVSSAGIRQ
jgi:phosphatidylglycerol---prolipoprotein diacylglyceryl transferase